MWYHQSVFYQIHPLGFCGAPAQNDGALQNRIGKVSEWIPHLRGLGADALYLCPVFQSDSHGYDTRDYREIDCRLGSDGDFSAVCHALHAAGIRVVLDGVFNHVGRGFWAFQDVCRNREASPYRDWFHIRFDADSPCGDGFAYEGWEGHYNLVKLNLRNPQVVEHLFACVRSWVERFGIDGLRLDVAYLLEPDFLRALRRFCDSLKPDFFLVGEAIHGDYNRIVGPEMLHSCTNYECYKGLHSSFNEHNLFEIAHSLNRQFGPENWTLYRGLPLFGFLDNHDVDRIASTLREPAHLRPAYGLLFGMPGIPCIYYGSEWGAKGIKQNGIDDALRPCFPAPEQGAMVEWISQLAALRRNHAPLAYGDYRQLYLTNGQFVFARAHEGEQVIVAVNADPAPHTAAVPVQGPVRDLLRGETTTLQGQLPMPPFSAAFYGRL